MSHLKQTHAEPSDSIIEFVNLLLLLPLPTVLHRSEAVLENIKISIPPFFAAKGWKILTPVLHIILYFLEAAITYHSHGGVGRMSATVCVGKTNE